MLPSPSHPLPPPSHPPARHVTGPAPPPLPPRTAGQRPAVPAPAHAPARPHLQHSSSTAGGLPSQAAGPGAADAVAVVHQPCDGARQVVAANRQHLQREGLLCRRPRALLAHRRGRGQADVQRDVLARWRPRLALRGPRPRAPACSSAGPRAAWLQQQRQRRPARAACAPAAWPPRRARPQPDRPPAVAAFRPPASRPSRRGSAARAAGRARPFPAVSDLLAPERVFRVLGSK
jgi:hypothetical protein